MGISIARYDTAGALDTTFGAGGMVTDATATARSVALQADGKIVVAGASNGGNSDFAVARYEGTPPQ